MNGTEKTKKKEKMKLENDLTAQTVPGIGSAAKRPTKKFDGGGLEVLSLRQIVCYGWEINAGFGVD